MSEWIIKKTMEDLDVNKVSRMNLLNTIDKSSLKLNTSILNSIDVTDNYYTQYLNNNLISHEYFGLKSGNEPYRLLIYISLLFNNCDLFDVGTYGGVSALALSSNPSNNIHSFDLVDKHSKQLHNEKNIHFYIEDILQHTEHHEKLLSSPFIYLDTLHDGAFESHFYNFLVKNNYKGILVLDDIYLNSEMKSFWNSINVKKFDITKYGHATGTGMVVFNDTINIELE